MRRKMFLKILITVVGSYVVLFFSKKSVIRNKILGRLRSYLTILEDRAIPEIGEFQFPDGYLKVSVETVLNSRCNSDSTNNQKYIHWGMFDNSKKLSDTQIEQIIEISKINLFFNENTEIIKNKNRLTIATAASDNSPVAMIEAGMQQQAICLACAALGIGMRFQNLGIAGKRIPNGKLGTTNIVIAPMKKSYNGSFWSKNKPAGWKAWCTGNLPEPSRDGLIPYLSVVSELKSEGQSQQKISMKTIGQLLWAAKGRTPHLYKSKPWGMTIPIWTDKIEITSVFLFFKNRLSKYINWKNGHPTHSLEHNNDVKISQFLSTLDEIGSIDECYLIFNRNDQYNRALWEIGYELFNTIVEASALKIPFKITFLSKEQQQNLAIEQTGTPEVVIAL